MKMKLFFKVLVLLFGLVIVLKFRDYAGSRTFVETVSAIFSTPKEANTMNWCTPQVVDVTWVTADISDNLKKMDMADLRDWLCEVKTEPIPDLDLDKVVWAVLAESHGPTAQKTVLEWNRDYSVFRAGGMPFKSSKLSAELQK